MQASDNFPLGGVIGVVAESADEIELAKNKGLTCIELRADLLLDRGLSESEVFNLIELGKTSGLGVLFTLRHPGHGGTFQGSEQQRVAMSWKAIDAGADLFDLEWGSEAAASLSDDKPPLILSYHDFNGMPDSQELKDLTTQMEGVGACAIKVVPTASNLKDALAMLRWTGQSNGAISRIGFAMGQAGSCSRILTTSHGGKVTYASFGAPVAPGQIDIDEMLTNYRIGDLDSTTQVTAVCVDGDAGVHRVTALNGAYAGEGRIAVGFSSTEKATIEKCADWMRISEIIS